MHSKFKKRRSVDFHGLFALLLSAVPIASSAQDQIYRCGNEYVNSITAEEASARRCNLISGGKVTVVPSAKTPAPSLTRPKVEGSSPAITSTGSGFRINHEGVVVTNMHVIRECKAIKVGSKPASVIASEPFNDLALLSTQIRGSFATMRTESAAIGETVEAVGFPLNGLLSGFNMTIGSVSSLTGIRGDKRYLQISAPVQQGNSGGPLLDSAGLVVGVVVGKLNAVKLAQATGDLPQNVNFAIDGGLLPALLDRTKTKY